jgi:hypothetical protein
MSASLAGTGPGSIWVRMNRSRSGPVFFPGSEGFHCVAGATVDSKATLCGPLRRS